MSAAPPVNVPANPPGNPPLPTTHPELQAAYPAHTLACILARVVAVDSRLGLAAPLIWHVAPPLTRLLGQAQLYSDELPEPIIPPGDHGWLTPTIVYDLPAAGVGEPTMAEHLLHLVFQDGVLLSRRTNDAIAALLDAEEANPSQHP